MKIVIPILIIGAVLGAKVNLPHMFTKQPVQVTTVTVAPIIEVTPTPIPLDAEVMGEIIYQFADHKRDEILKLLNTANGESGITWNRVSVPNKDGSIDYGIFQINSLHIKRFGDKFTYDWKENVRVAHVIYDEQGLTPWVAAKKLGYVK